MKTILSILAILMALVSSAQSNWEKIPLTDKVTISFPAKPISAILSEGQKSYILKQADSTANYIVAVSDMQVLMGIDATTLEAEMEKEEFWEQAKTAFVNSMGSEAKLIKDEMTAIKNTKTLKLVIERNGFSGSINTLTVFIFIHGTNSFNVIFNNRGGRSDNKLVEQFFGSIDIKE